MTKTTVYLPPELKRALARLARERRCSEAELLREAVARLAAEGEAPAPKLPLFRSKGASIAEDIDRALEGFGRQTNTALARRSRAPLSRGSEAEPRE